MALLYAGEKRGVRWEEKKKNAPPYLHVHSPSNNLAGFLRLSQGANSTEFNEKPEEAAVVFMPEINADQMGGTMRLGGRTTLFRPYSGDAAASVTLAKQLYVHFTVQ